MTQKNQDSVCISLTDTHLKVAHVKGMGLSAKVVNIAGLEVTGYSEPDIQKALKSCLKGVSLKRSHFIFLAPPSVITSKNIEVPSTSPEEVSSIVDLQASRHTPLSREEIEVGYVNIGVYGNATKALLVIANRAQLQSKLSLIERVGLKIKTVLVASEGIATLYGESPNLQGQVAPVGIIDVDNDSTEFVISVKGIPVTSRSIPVGRVHLTSEGTTARSRLVEELKKTVESYKSEDVDQLPGTYVLTQGDQINGDLQADLKSQLQWESDIIPYEGLLKLNRGVLKKVAKTDPYSSFLDVCSGAAMAPFSQMNLVPAEVQLQKSVQEQGREALKMAVLSLFILTLVASFVGVRYFFHKSYLAKVDKEFAMHREDVSQLEKTSARTKIIKDFLDTRMQSLDVVKELYTIVPKEIYLSAIQMDEDNLVSIQGIAQDTGTVYKWGTPLKNSELFKTVKIESTKAKKDKGKDASAFEISLGLDAVEEPIETQDSGE